MYELYNLCYLFRVLASFKSFKCEGENTKMTILELIPKSYGTD